MAADARLARSSQRRSTAEPQEALLQTRPPHQSLSRPWGAAQVACAAVPVKRRLVFYAAAPPAKRLHTLDPATLPLPDDDDDEDAYPPGEGSEERSQFSHEGDSEEAGSERSPSAGVAAAPTPRSIQRVYICDSGRVYMRMESTVRPCPRSTPTTCVPGTPGSQPCRWRWERAACARSRPATAPAARSRTAHILSQPAARRAR